MSKEMGITCIRESIQSCQQDSKLKENVKNQSFNNQVHNQHSKICNLHLNMHSHCNRRLKLH